MPTLHRLKFLATHCATTPATTHSPAASPVLRRRKTLRTLLHQDPPELADKEVRIRVRHKLKDLLLSSPPPPPLMETMTIGDGKIRRRGQRKEQQGLLPAVDTDSGGLSFRFRNGSAAFRLGAVSLGFRHRVLRRAWRPMLLTIPE